MKKKILLIAMLMMQPIATSGWAQESLRTKEFAVMGYQGLLLECRSGKGPYLQTLSELLALPADEQRKILAEVCGLIEKYPNIMEFAEKVMAYQKGPVPVQVSLPLPEGPGVVQGQNLEDHLNHLTRGAHILIHTKGGAQFSGIFEEYASHRVWIRGAAKRSFHLEDIFAIEAPRD